ncbi:class I SAM-dependent methyltransferase [Chloroflexota bacterium]
MALGTKLIKVYFDLIYNPVYDFTTAQLAPYHALQTRCIDKFRFDDGDKVLCVGAGTGNEVIHILRKNSSVSVVGIDYSNTALQRAYKKALALGKKIEVLNMDARSLEFATGSFDKIVCLHVMDFIEDHCGVTKEILRVLKDEGQFVVTYPSDKEGAKLGCNLLKESFRHNLDSKKHRIRVFLQFLVKIVVGSVYLPLLLRSKKISYSRYELETLFFSLMVSDFQIEEYPIYQDFIVYGTK